MRKSIYKIIDGRLFLGRTRLHRIVATLALGTIVSAVPAQQLIYQEGFNNDGETNVPPRYTTIGRDVYEVPRIISELNRTDQLGPIYWAHNFEVSFVGVPAPTPARRAILAWDGSTTDDEISTNFWKLFEATLSWLTKNKAPASTTLIFSPNQAAAQSLADHLATLGYTVTDDDSNITDAS